MKSYQKILAAIALSSMCLGVAVASDGDVVVKKTKKHHVVKSEAKPVCEACEAIKQLKEQVAAQQAQIDQLRNAQLPAAGSVAYEKAAADAQQQAAAAAAAAAEANAKAAAAQSDVAGLKIAVNNATQEAQTAEKKVSELEAPAYIHYKGVKLTPGGFLAAETLWRQHTENADIGSSYSGIPFTDSTQYHLSEWRGTARQSRLSLLAEGQAGPTALTGYYEMDFLGAAPTANENQSSSFQPRIRQLFGKVSMNGWSLTAGQTWSLLTTDRTGTDARSEWLPATIDGQYVVGFTWARLMTVRLAKTFDDNKVTAAFSLENPATLAPKGTAPSGVTILDGGAGTGQLANGAGSTAGTGGNFSANLAPDLIAKVAIDPGYGHYEIKAVGRFFRDRVESGTTGTNYNSLGAGLGAAAILPIVSKKVDFIAEGMFGRGIARYGDSSNVDVTYRPNGSFSPVKNLHALIGLEAQVTPKLSWYVYGGDEYQGRDTYRTTVGFGLPTVSVASCDVANSNSCGALMKNLDQGTTGFWYNFYKGGYGTLRYGMQYSYTHEATWAGATGLAPKANENMAFTSLRYYLP